MERPDNLSPDTQAWDWEKGRRTILSSVDPGPDWLWQEEFHVSPDGETLAAIIRSEDESFTLRVNDSEWETPFEKAWLPKFSPDGRLTALVMLDDEWTLAVDGTPWDERFSFAWGTRFGNEGQICASIQQDMQYGFCVDGVVWENLFENATDMSFSSDGSRNAAVVQVNSLKQADLEGFSKGAYSVAVDSQAWDASFMNVWTPVFDHRGRERVAAQVRLSETEYSIAVDGVPWKKRFGCVWAPAFNPATGALVAPARTGGRWGMVADEAFIWAPVYYQCMNQQWSEDGNNLWAIVAPEYGKFTVAKNNTPWQATFPVITDLTLSPSGARAAALACHANVDFRILVDGNVWQGSWDMAWKPVFSPDSSHVAALVRDKNGAMTYLVDNKLVKESFTKAWPPVFSSDNQKVLLKGIQNNAFVRIVLPLGEIA